MDCSVQIFVLNMTCISVIMAVVLALMATGSIQNHRCGQDKSSLNSKQTKHDYTACNTRRYSRRKHLLKHAVEADIVSAQQSAWRDAQGRTRTEAFLNSKKPERLWRLTPNKILKTV
jgi:hypothetical protein